MRTTIRKIIIFGATGSIGRRLVEQALAENYEVTAFVRDPAKLNAPSPNLKIAAGDVLNAEAVAQAICGQEAVIYAVGAGSRGQVRADGTQNVVSAMRTANVKRLIALSSLGVGESRDSLNFFWKHIMFGLLLRKAYADHERQEEIIKSSLLDWTIVRPSAFTDDAPTGAYRHGNLSGENKLKLKIPRRDVAAFMIGQLRDPQYLRQSPGVSN